jgi:hypothetical protein
VCVCVCVCVCMCGDVNITRKGMAIQRNRDGCSIITHISTKVSGATWGLNPSMKTLGSVVLIMTCSNRGW